jgi:hypothetical protein
MRLYQGWARINASVNTHARFYDYIDALTNQINRQVTLTYALLTSEINSTRMTYIMMTDKRACEKRIFNLRLEPYWFVTARYDQRQICCRIVRRVLNIDRLCRSCWHYSYDLHVVMKIDYDYKQLKNNHNWSVPWISLTWIVTGWWSATLPTAVLIDALLHVQCWAAVYATVDWNILADCQTNPQQIN